MKVYIIIEISLVVYLKMIKSYNIKMIKMVDCSTDLFFDPDKEICVFNGCHEDHFYNGMENFLL
jgi:hypothetical protein